MTASTENKQLQQAAKLIEHADALIVGAGAGMGVDSGLPDFRGREGFWRAYPALGRAQVDFHSIASPHAFRAHPRRAWGFYGHRLNLYRATVPHASFQILKRWGEQRPHGYAVFTSNVDGQFQKAGFCERALVECHGSIHHLQCLTPCCEVIWAADELMPQVDAEECLLLNSLPKCPRCGGLARPNILMFGDSEWIEQRQIEQQQALESWLSVIRRPVIVEIGAGTAIPSVRHFSQRILREFGGRMIRINPRAFDVPSPLDIGLASGSASALIAIDDLVF